MGLGFAAMNAYVCVGTAAFTKDMPNVCALNANNRIKTIVVIVLLLIGNLFI
jgi:hypothetical protein